MARVKRNRKRVKWRTFLNDVDGVSARDYLLVLSTLVFFGFISLGLIKVLVGKEISESYLSLLDLMTPTIVTIIGSVMSVHAFESFNSSRGKDISNLKEVKKDEDRLEK